VQGTRDPAAVRSAGSGPLLTGGAQSLHGEGDLRASRQWFDAAYRAAERTGDGPAMARAALGLGGLWLHEHRDVAAAALVQARQQEALALVDAESPLGLRLRARLAAEADYRTGRSGAVRAVLDEARGLGDPVALAEALNLAHHCLLGPDDGAVRRPLAEELIGVSARTGRRSDLLVGLLWRTVDGFLDADPHAERGLGELRALLAGGDHVAIGFVVGAIEVMLHIRAGRFAEAEALAAANAERGTAAGDADATAWYGAQLIAIRWYQGRIGELVPMLGDLVHSPTLSAVDNSLFAALAVASASAGDRRQAAGTLARLSGRGLADLPRSSSWLVAIYGVVEAAHLVGDAELAAQAYAVLLPYARLPMMASLGVACFGSAHHALGVAALTTGDLDRAVEHLREAIRQNLGIWHWPAAVLSRLRLADALALRGAPAEAEEARSVAASEAAALGMALPAGHAVTGEPGRPAVCERHGRRWRIELGGRAVLVEHSVGLRYLAVLLANPGREIPAVELAAGPDVPSGTRTGSAQPVLDDTAKREYRQRLDRLQEEIDAGTGRAAAARAERDWLVAELAAAAGLAGRTRTFATGEERARVAVGKAIRRALDRVAAADPYLGADLRASVQTGIRCCYRPA
jgi:hypothetical protein